MLQFFKTFCLSYYDYCLSICIYYSKTLLAKLYKSYYTCLYRLFKFNLVDCTISTVQTFLTRYELSSIQYRVFVKLSIMFYNMHQPSAPFDLRVLLAQERTVIPYNLRRHCQFARNRFVNSRSDLEFDAVFVEWCNVTEILNFHAPFKNFLSIFRKSRISSPTCGQILIFFIKNS